MRDKWHVTVYNQITCQSFYAYGSTRAKAFNAAVAAAGEPWLRAGGDKLTMLRTLFAYLVKHHPHMSRIDARVYISDPCGAGVELRRFR